MPNQALNCSYDVGQHWKRLTMTASLVSEGKFKPSLSHSLNIVENVGKLFHKLTNYNVMEFLYLIITSRSGNI